MSNKKENQIHKSYFKKNKKNKKKSDLITYWMDPNHEMSLRIIDSEKKIIYGSENSNPFWVVNFKELNPNPKRKIEVDFHSKKTHRGLIVLQAEFTNNGNKLKWQDGNIWTRTDIF